MEDKKRELLNKIPGLMTGKQFENLISEGQSQEHENDVCAISDEFVSSRELGAVSGINNAKSGDINANESANDNDFDKTYNGGEIEYGAVEYGAVEYDGAAYGAVEYDGKTDDAYEGECRDNAHIDFDMPIVNHTPSDNGDGSEALFSGDKTYNSNAEDKAKTEISAVQQSVEIAYNKCLSERGDVDIDYISAESGVSGTEVCECLKDRIYPDPEKQKGGVYGYSTAEEYLSGNLMRKYNAAARANKTNPEFMRNIKALLAMMPPMPDLNKIYISLGSPWIPEKYISDFVQYLFRTSLLRNKRICEVFYQKSICRRTIALNIDVRATVLAVKTYGTARIDMFRILERILNHEIIRICDVEETDGKTIRRLNREQTMLAEEKRQKLESVFRRWIGELPEDDADTLREIYYEKFCCYSKRVFSGAALKLSDLNPAVSLYDYQKDAVARIIESPTSLIAHDVGAGKTYVMIAAAHEMRRIGLSKKNMFVVPNSIISQWSADYALLYPEAPVFTAAPESFSPSFRAQTLKKMADGDYEAIIIAYSSFESIQDDCKALKERLDNKISEIESEAVDNARRRAKVKSKLNAELTRVKSKIIKYAEKVAERQCDEICFSALGINTLFIDEAHNYKNLPLDTSLSGIKGINADGSVKCLDVWIKTLTVLRNNGGRGLVFATGTPITNSLTDVYVMQKYLAESELKRCDIDCFDNWAGMFGEITSDYEIDVDTNNYRLTTRFNRFCNLSELSLMMNEFTDFHAALRSGLPEAEKPVTVVVEKTERQRALLDEISSRVDAIRMGAVDRKTDNLLKVTTDGRKLALDSRLVDAHYAGETEVSENEDGDLSCGAKIVACAEKIKEIYDRYPGKTQLVFCDIGTPKAEFNVYDELKRTLIKMKIAPSEIGFVHDATSDIKRAKMFESVNNSAIRILIGSTFKLGTGVNVQNKLIALHHLDVPWRPSDMVQREGRMIRQGNTNEKVFVYRYVTDGSFDAYSWQLLENKQRFISDLLSGTVTVADDSKTDDSVLSYAEVKALAVGNPLVKKRVELFNEILKLKAIMSDEAKKRHSLLQMKASLPQEIAEYKEKAACAREDFRAFKECEKPDKSAIAPLISKTINGDKDGIEREICDYACFKLILPSKFNRSAPYLVLKGKGKYIVDLFTFGIGAAIRVENYASSLSDRAKEFADAAQELNMQLKQTEQALCEDNAYSPRMRELEIMLKETDEQLGIAAS